MKDIPQPAQSAYEVGDRVQVYLGPDDIDSQYHGTDCVVTEILEDDLHIETGRPTDRYKYSLENAQTADPLPVPFRHYDLIPAEQEQGSETV